MAAAEDPPPLSRRIREARLRLDITQEEAARRLNMSLGGYTAYERHREPKPSRARDIAVAFGLEPDYFLGPPQPEEETNGSAQLIRMDQRLEAIEGDLAEMKDALTILLRRRAQARRRDEDAPPQAGSR